MAAKADGKLKVFVSYSRNDLKFADQLVAALDAFGFEVVIDRQDISGGENFAQRLSSLILDADTVVFVLSPESVVAKYCIWEVEEADRRGKRLIPIVCEPLDTAPVPPRLKSLDYIFFYDEVKSPGSGFGLGMARLIESLKIDLVWIREHTRLMGLASRWEQREKPEALLLRDNELEDAERWLATHPREAPEPTSQQRAFLAASRAAQEARSHQELTRLDEMQKAQEARAKALADSEAAQRQREAALRTAEAAQAARARTQRWVWRLTAGIAGLVVLMLGGTVWQAYNTAIREAYLLMSKSQEAFGKSQYERAMQYALASMPPTGATPLAATLPDSDVELARAAHRSRLIGRLGGKEARFENAVFSPDGSMILTRAKGEHEAVLWDAADGTVLHSLIGHTAELTSAVFIGETPFVRTMSRDNTVRVWNSRTREETARIGSADEPATSLSPSRDGSRVAAWAEGRPVRVWDTMTRKSVSLIDQNLGSQDTASLSPDGRTLATRTAKGGFLRLWDTDKGTPIGAPLPIGDFASIGFNAKGDRLRVTGRQERDYKVLLIDCANGAVLAQIDNDARGRFMSSVFSPDGTRLAVRGWADSTVRFWDASTGSPSVQLKGHRGGINSIEFFKDGNKVLTTGSDRTARLWDAATGNQTGILSNLENGISDIRINPSETRVLLSGGERTLLVWNPETGVAHPIDARHSNSRYEISKNGKKVVTSALHADDVMIWDMESGRLSAVISTPGDPRSAINADGTRVLTRDGVDGSVRLWNADSLPHQRWHTELQEGAAGSSIVNSHVAATGKDGLLRLWNINERREVAVLPDSQAWNFLALSHDARRIAVLVDNGVMVWDVEKATRIGQLSGLNTPYDAAQFSRDGTTLMLVDTPRRLALWDVGSPALLWQHQAAADIRVPVLSPTGERVAYAGSDKKLVLLDRAGQPSGPAIEVPTPFSQGLSFNADGSRLLWGGDTNEALLLETSTLRTLAKLPAGPQRAWVIRSSFSRDGSRMLTATDDDRMVRVWSTATGAKFGRDMKHDAAIADARLNRTGTMVVTATKDGKIHVWDVATGTAAATIDAHLVADRQFGEFSADFNEDATEVGSIANDNTIRAWDIRLATLRGAALRERVCGNMLRGVQQFADDDMTNAIIRGNESLRNPCDRHGMLSSTYWKRLPGVWSSALFGPVKP